MPPLLHPTCCFMLVTIDQLFNKPLLHTASTGMEVVEIQKLLTHWNIYNGAIDGVFSHQLEQAVKAFQRRVFLPEDGVVGLLTWRSLHAGTPIDMPVLQRGSAGNAVVLLQKALQAAGQKEIALDGVFEHQNEAAVQQFQRRQGLVADGVVANCTWLALSKIPR